ncbi:hypothetical protein [Streptomyces sp. RerS4]|nr:hypothetical protein [Streptomyces sp. RerS4]
MVRHPLRFLDSNGFGQGLTSWVLLFLTLVGGSLAYVYFAYLS